LESELFVHSQLLPIDADRLSITSRAAILCSAFVDVDLPIGRAPRVRGCIEGDRLHQSFASLVSAWSSSNLSAGNWSLEF
jgi:hypothetical protein